jgi:hypothetical protein
VLSHPQGRCDGQVAATFLRLKQLRRELIASRSKFFTFTSAECEVIEQRRRPELKLGAEGREAWRKTDAESVRSGQRCVRILRSHWFSLLFLSGCSRFTFQRTSSPTGNSFIGEEFVIGRAEFLRQCNSN